MNVGPVLPGLFFKEFSNVKPDFVPGSCHTTVIRYLNVMSQIPNTMSHVSLCLEFGTKKACMFGFKKLDSKLGFR